MIPTSNTTQFATLTSTYVAVKLASGLSINTNTTLFTGDTKGSVITDILFRNTDAANTRNLDIFIGSSATPENNRVQVVIPANAGNNGSVVLASLASLAPSLFDLDLNGNRIINIESGIVISCTNKAALTADMFITLKTKGF
ncbi:MAG: hypothetical protein JWQ09_5865 [Segetibacter sp.]|nr:hypothetical protein [Segetibacter sp.]